jgi:hypothetical protein
LLFWGELCQPWRVVISTHKVKYDRRWNLEPVDTVKRENEGGANFVYMSHKPPPERISVPIVLAISAPAHKPNPATVYYLFYLI